MGLNMSRVARSGFMGAALALALAWLGAAAPGQPASPPRKGSAEAGARLFSGAVRLASGGPPCAGCHAAAGIPFPNGGSLGPDLTGTFAKFGTASLGQVLATLPFPTMTPIFRGRVLTAAEQDDLAAFFAAAGAASPPTARTSLFVGLSGAGCAALLAAAGLVWRRRLAGVRRALLRKTRGPRGRPA
jgi:hypothetical protein